jgi:hypothetical protein
MEIIFSTEKLHSEYKHKTAAFCIYVKMPVIFLSPEPMVHNVCQNEVQWRLYLWQQMRTLTVVQVKGQRINLLCLLTNKCVYQTLKQIFL